MSLKQKLTVLGSAGAMAIALTVIEYFEGVRYEPYEDVSGVLTVCYGHTGKDIIPNKVYSKDECNELLESDFQRTKQQVDKLVKVPTDDYTKAALYSFAFNVGTGAFAKSTMLKSSMQVTNTALVNNLKNGFTLVARYCVGWLIAEKRRQLYVMETCSCRHFIYAACDINDCFRCLPSDR